VIRAGRQIPIGADDGLTGVRTESCWNDCLKEE